jgi:hypothetical protein
MVGDIAQNLTTLVTQELDPAKTEELLHLMQHPLFDL